MSKDFLASLREWMKPEQIFTEELMSRHTTFRLGGPAQFYLQPEAEQVGGILRVCRQYGMPYLVIGNGSNLLVGDKGIRGVVIELGKRMEDIRVEETKVTATAGSLLSRVASEAADRGLAGMEFAAGIPGCIGGAVVMNAGAYGGEMKQIVKSVTVITEEGSQLELGAEELELSYRHSCISEKKLIVLYVTLELETGNREEIKSRMKELNQQRREKQPLEYPSGGSTFQRPQGHYAGKLIMDAGLQGFQVGGAQVAEKHCGFVINTGEATALDVQSLVRQIEEIVEKKFGVILKPEIKMIGDF